MVQEWSALESPALVQEEAAVVAADRRCPSHTLSPVVAHSQLVRLKFPQPANPLVEERTPLLRVAMATEFHCAIHFEE